MILKAHLHRHSFPLATPPFLSSGLNGRGGPWVRALRTSAHRDLCPVHMLIVPAQVSAAGLFLYTRRQHRELLAVIAVIIPSVFVLFLYPPAHLYGIVFRYGDVSPVEQPVDVRAQQQAVGDGVRSGFGVGLYVRGLERRHRALAAYGAAPPVGVRYKQAEAALPHSYLREEGAVEVRRWRVRDEGVALFYILFEEAVSLKPLFHVRPDRPALGLFGGIGLAAYDVLFPRGRRVEPVFFSEKYGIGQDYTADYRVRLDGVFIVPVTQDGASEFRVRRAAVSGAEGVPGQRQREPRVAYEKANAAYGVFGILKLEEEGGAALEGFEGCLPAGLPEVYVLRVVCREEGVPVGVGYAEVEVHGMRILYATNIINYNSADIQTRPFLPVRFRYHTFRTAALIFQQYR